MNIVYEQQEQLEQNRMKKKKKHEIKVQNNNYLPWRKEEFYILFLGIICHYFKMIN